MRFTLMVFLLIVLKCNFCSAQYVPVPTDNSAIWRVDYYDFDNCGLPQPNAQMQYTFAGDTSINNLTYKKVLTSGVSACLTMGLIWGYLRDDTILRKVFFMSVDSTTEGVLYDFNQGVGDTIPNYFGYLGQQPFIIDSIDTIFLGGINRKRIRYIPDILTLVDPYIIEGIGALTGLISPLSGEGSAYVLECFSDYHQTIFPDATTSCQLINSISNKKFNTDIHLKIKDGLLNVENTSSERLKSIKIFNSISQIIKQTTESQLNISDLHGIYIVEVLFQNMNSYRYKIFIH